MAARQEERAVAEVYSTYEAKAKFSEVLRKVRAGKRVTIAYRGKEIAQVIPMASKQSMEERLRELEERGVLTRAKKPAAALKPLANRPGALQLFLEERD
jgi:prevent-host-death family protein